VEGIRFLKEFQLVRVERKKEKFVNFSIFTITQYNALVCRKETRFFNNSGMKVLIIYSR